MQEGSPNKWIEPHVTGTFTGLNRTHAEATLGSRMAVRLLDGRKVTIRIPPGTPSGKRFRVRGQGIEKNGNRGDLIVETEITVPEKLTPEQEQAMKDFAESGGLKY